jgi:cation-transporting ATPase E
MISLALKGADCSIAMASGSSAARNVAHIVSLDNDFSKLPDVVAEGRRVINNLQRTATLFLTKTVFAFLTTLIFLLVSWATNQGFRLSFNDQEHVRLGDCYHRRRRTLLIASAFERTLKGSYLRNVLSKSAPGGIVCVFAVCVYFLDFARLAPAFLDMFRGIRIPTF